MENEMISTPPSLATVGLRRNRGESPTLNRRFKVPDKLVASTTVDELFVSRPQFKKQKLGDDQGIKEKGEENALWGSSSLAMNPRKKDVEEMMEKGDGNWLTFSRKGPKSTTIDQSMKNLADENDGWKMEIKKEDDDYNIPSDRIDPRLLNLLTSDSATRWVWREFNDFHKFFDLSGAYDLGSFLKEYFPQLQTRFLPRRGWQLLRRSLGKARRFSPAFIEMELKAQGLSTRCEPLPLKQTPHSRKLLEAVMRVKLLLKDKKKVLHEISLKNKEIGDDKDSKNWSSSQIRDTKAMFQRCFTSLYRMNEDIVAPMTLLHEHVDQYRKKMEEEKVASPTAFDIYDKCLKKAELELQLAERYKSLKLKSSANRELVVRLQTLLYVTGELGGPNSADLLVLMDQIFENLAQNVPPALRAQLNQTMKNLEPNRKRMKELYKSVPKEEPTEDDQ